MMIGTPKLEAGSLIIPEDAPWLLLHYQLNQ
jgi:hypothetical protein